MPHHRVHSRSAAAVLICAGALALGCGSGNGSTSTTTTTTCGGGNGTTSASTTTSTSTGSGGQGGGASSSSSSSGTGGSGATGPVGVDPSNGMGGDIAPGQTGTTPLGAVIRIPAGYDPAHFASPVIWLFNEQLSWWSAVADADRIVLVDLAEYNDVNKIVAKLNETQNMLEAGYDVDKARYFWAGWSAGGNIAIIAGAQNQDTIAGTLVFPGTGGNIAQPYMQANTGHKIRMFYACGDQDPNFSWMAVENETNVWASYGYTTTFVKVPGAAHYLDEAIYGVRAQGWAWIKGYNLKN